VPTIAIEFVSNSQRDRKRDFIEKREEYAAAGVREYWIIARFRRSMTVFCGTETEHIVAEGETYKTKLLPGFELQLSRLLEIADRVTGE
jgi:Uma2 family endonuclease